MHMMTEVYLYVCVCICQYLSCWMQCRRHDNVPFNPRMGNCRLQGSGGKSIDPSFHVCLQIPHRDTHTHTHTQIMDSGGSRLAGQVPQMDKQDVPWIVSEALSCSPGTEINMFEARTLVVCVKAVQIYLDHVCVCIKNNVDAWMDGTDG